MARTINPASAHRVKMANRRRMSFGRTFIKTLAAGKPHHDTAKVTAFVQAAGVKIPARAKADDVNFVAAGLVMLIPAKDLPRNTAI